MKCSDLQLNLSLFGDAELDSNASSAVSWHLEVCPLCRQRVADYREIGSGLKRLGRPGMPAGLQDRIRTSVRSEKYSNHPFIPSADLREWLTMRLMPYTVGLAASITIGTVFLTMMFSGMLRPESGNTLTGNGGRTVLMASNSDPFTASESLITPADYAQTRLGFGYESPSVNPQGALIALTKSFMRGGMKDDEVVVVADVFGNGLARIEEVVEPSHDRQAVLKLQKALQSDPDFAPFVPSYMENRPDSVRVVLKFQNVNVSTREPSREPR
jgi:hypothetical protein